MIQERAQVAVGPLLAEGGEGRVFEVDGHADVLFKEFRTPMPLAWASSLVRWPRALAGEDPAAAARVRAATAWPSEVVADGDRVAGLLLPRAPDGFWVRHRDGTPRLATLSYLTADPAQREAAYGLHLPPPLAPERVALAYALARLLVALHGADPPVSHGDLSARNVLWSLQNTPRIFVIDCDNSEIGDGGDDGRRRAMTPNWDDPAVAAGANPDAASDRYSLALIFLRVVGAAHYPVQLRQRRGETVAIDFDVPADVRHLPSLRRGAPLWALCSAGLSLRRQGRPPAAAWAEVLETILGDLGRPELAAGVRAAQDGTAVTRAAQDSRAVTRAAQDSRTAPVTTVTVDRNVVVRPVAASVRTQAWRRAITRPAEEDEVVEVQTLGVQARRQLRYAAGWWWLAHRRMVRLLVTRRSLGRGLRRLVFLFLVDFALACAAVFLFAMIVSPFLGI